MSTATEVISHPFFSEYPVNAGLTVVVGKKGIGKTKETMDELIACVSESDEPVRVLVFDVNDEFGALPEISLNDIGDWASIRWQDGKEMPITVEGAAMRRVRVFRPDGKVMTLEEMEEALEIVLDKFCGGILLIDDICKYVSDASRGVAAIITARSKRQKIVLHMQTIGAASKPKVFGNINILRMHKTFDVVDRHKDKLEDRYDMLRIAEIIIDKKYRGITMGDEVIVEPNPRFFLYCNFDSDKIIGDFTESDAKWAIREFIDENKPLVKRMLNSKNENGELVYVDWVEAFRAACELMEQYFDFKK